MFQLQIIRPPPFVVRNREPIRPQKGAAASLMVAATQESEITKGILQQYGPIRIRNKTRRDSALKVLVENHWLKLVKKGKGQIIQINP